MEGAPRLQSKFERVNETPHGAVLRRVREQHELAQVQFGAPEYEQLEGKKAGRLRMALALAGALGMAGVSGKVVYDHQSETMTEGRPTAAAPVTPEKVPVTQTVTEQSTAISKVSALAPETSVRPQMRTKQSTEPEVTEDIPDTLLELDVADAVAAELPSVAEEMAPEVQVDSPSLPESAPDLSDTEYEKRIEGYIARLQLRKDELLFLDEYGAPVGEPVKMEDVTGPLPPGKTVKEGQAPVYKYSPGPMHEAGFPANGVSKEWMDYMQELQQTNYPETTITDRTHVVTDFGAFFKDSDLAALQEKIMNGEIETYAEALDYFISQPFAGSEGLNRIEYLRQHIQFRSEDEEIKISSTESVTRRAVPPEVQERLLFYIPGLLAQESKFRDDLRNKSTGAVGCGQFIQATWKRYTGEETVSKECARQIAVMGPALSDMYDRFQTQLTPEAVQVLRGQFASELEYQLEFVARGTIAGYNNGPDRTAEVASRYVESVQVADMPHNADLFMQITEFGKLADGGLLSEYGEHSAEYMERVEAGAYYLAEKYPYEQKSVIASYRDGEQFAMND